MALASGTKLGPYEIQSALGAGGMGEVYRARDVRLNRDVAIKVLPAAFARDPDRLRRFQQEAQAVAALNHPNILAIHDFGEHEGSPYIFGLDHYRVQGADGAEQAAIVGLIYGTIFAATDRIWVIMFAHAAFDLTALAMIYWNLESRIAHLVFH
jgi:serine/threonine protein kinase